MVRTLFALLALAGCDGVWGLSFDHPDAPRDTDEIDAMPDAARSLYAEAVLADHPIGYWRFSAGASPTATDLVGQVPGVYRGEAAPSAAGALLAETDTAVALDGTGDFVDMGSTFGFEGRAPFTIEAWVNPKTHGGYIGVVSKDDETNGGSSRKGWHMYSEIASFGFERSSGLAVQDVRSGPLMTLRWTHVAVTYDGTALTLFVDGGLRASTLQPNPAIPTTTGAFVVGARNGGEFLFLSGSVDELAVYALALTKEQLLAHRLIALGQ